LTQGPNRRLDSWKEIADYIGRDVRTAIRWEKRGLPVHRVPGGMRQAVFSYTAEIDAWAANPASTEPPLSAPSTAQEMLQPPAAARPVRRALWLLAATLPVALLLIWLIRNSQASTAGPPPLATPLSFVRADYPARMPMSIAAADLNRDGRPDLIFTNAGDGSLGVLLGDGSGGFLRQTKVLVGKQPERLALADFNGDGKLDVAVTDWTLGRLSILVGRGDGSFSAGENYSVEGRARWVSASDLNRDAKIDLVVAGSASSRIWVFAGQGNATFRLAGSYEAERDVSSLALDDFNRDGHIDVVAGDYRVGTGKSVSIYLGKGDLTFHARLPSRCNEGPLGMASADVNGDGRLDVVTANFRGVGASVLLGAGDGRFALASAVKTGAAPGFVQIADLDRDGKLDLLVLNEHSDDASALLGDGAGNFAAATQFATGRYPDAAALADFDGDGRLDFATANVFGDSISVMLNRTPARPGKSWLAALQTAIQR
jgi:hypothetical protein